MTEYYFTRHGESQANVDQVFAGVMDSPLTEKGRTAARAEGERLARAGVVYDLIISSPLSRALETTRIISATQKEKLWQRVCCSNAALVR